MTLMRCPPRFVRDRRCPLLRPYRSGPSPLRATTPLLEPRTVRHDQEGDGAAVARPSRQERVHPVRPNLARAGAYRTARASKADSRERVNAAGSMPAVVTPFPLRIAASSRACNRLRRAIDCTPRLL